MDIKKIKVLYWISTAFVVIVCLFSGILNILMTDAVKELSASHGFNIYLAPFLGTVKILGAAGITIPLLKRFVYAAYCGLIYYFIGATYINIIDHSASYVTTIVILTAVSISCYCYQKLW